MAKFLDLDGLKRFYSKIKVGKISGVSRDSNGDYDVKAINVGALYPDPDDEGAMGEPVPINADLLQGNSLKDIEGKIKADVYSKENPPEYPVTSVNGQTGAVVIKTPTIMFKKVSKQVSGTNEPDSGAFSQVTIPSEIPSVDNIVQIYGSVRGYRYAPLGWVARSETSVGICSVAGSRIETGKGYALTGLTSDTTITFLYYVEVE